MTGYDFDKTIYKGDSTIDFFFYVIFTRPYLLVFSPWFLIASILYGVKIFSKKKYKENMFFFIPWLKNLDRIVDSFWKHNANKIADYYVHQKKEDDIIISASLLFIIKPMIDTLDIKNLIATNFSVSTGKIIGKNCYGKQKAIEFERLYPKTTLEAFYSDSTSDVPMMLLSERAFLVEGEAIREIEIKGQ